MLDLVTIGETMVVFIPRESGYLRYVSEFTKKTAGAESNVAIGLAKLGHSSGWISKIGNDEFGEFLLRELRGEGVDTSRVLRSDTNPTGLMFKQFRSGGETSVFYYRRDSAASTLCPEDLDADYIRSARIVHLSGITPALSASCAETVPHIMRIAREAGALVSFDPNIRLRLWDAARAKQTLAPLFAQSDIVLIGQDEGEMLVGEREPEGIIAALRAQGARWIAVKMGKRGAMVADQSESFMIPIVDGPVVDNVGAGDAFDAGFLCGILEGCGMRECGEMGSIMGGAAVSANGDVEGLPNREQFDRIRQKATMIYR